MAKVVFLSGSNQESSLVNMLPQTKEEDWKVSLAEKMFDPLQMLTYYRYAIAYGVLDYLPDHHKQIISNIVDAGILDDVLAAYYPGLTDSYVINNRFYYKGKEFKPPQGYIPQIRYRENNKIMVLCCQGKKEPQLFHFEAQNKRNRTVYRWHLASSGGGNA